MTSAAYKILKLKELEALRRERDCETFQKALEAPESDAAETSPATPAPTTPNLPESTILIPGEPCVRREVEPVPPELAHLGYDAIELLALDGDERAQKFLQTRQNIPLYRGVPGRLDWMR